MRRLALLIGYDGTRYAGWQRQESGLGVQQVMEDRLRQQFGEEVHLMASGRTDAGVHAQGQVAAMDLENPLSTQALVRAMNANLPEDIRVYAAVETAADFQPRFDAKRKTYIYRFFNGPVMPVSQRLYAAQVKPALDRRKMEASLKTLVGEHDFLAFRASGGVNLTTVRTVYEVSLTEETVEEVLPGVPEGIMYRLSITGNGFLYKMVRTIAGTMIKIGYGAIPEDAMEQALKTKDRTRLGPTAPARGLTLLRVEYDSLNFENWKKNAEEC